jgi:primase-polymerase (primpol)-like protein
MLNLHTLAAHFKRVNACTTINVPLAFDSGDPLAGLKARAQWVVWRLEQFEGDKKPRKIPYDPKTFQYANTMDAATWSTFEHAYQIASIYPEFKPGFVFTLDDPYIFIDLDGCRNPETGQFDEETTRIFTSVFPNAAAEVSQSGTGLHLIMRGDKTQFGNRRNKWEGRFEFYQSGRFIAIAGNAWQGNADTDHTAALQTFLPIREYDSDKREIEISRDLRWNGPEDDQDLLIRMFASDDKISTDRIAKLHTIIQRDPTNFMAKVELQKIEKRVAFAALWQGDANVLRHCYPSPTAPFDHSAADLSLMNKLAFWTGRDHERMIRLFSMSALGKRDKWMTRSYYVTMRGRPQAR